MIWSPLYIFKYLCNYILTYLASKCLVKEVLVVAIKTVCKRIFSSTSWNDLWSSVTRGSFVNSIREMLVDFRVKHLSSRYPSSMVDNPKLCDNRRLTCEVSGLKRRKPEKIRCHCNLCQVWGFTIQKCKSKLLYSLRQHWALFTLWLPDGFINSQPL